MQEFTFPLDSKFSFPNFHPIIHHKIGGRPVYNGISLIEFNLLFHAIYYEMTREKELH